MRHICINNNLTFIDVIYIKVIYLYTFVDIQYFMMCVTTGSRELADRSVIQVHFVLRGRGGSL